MAKRFSELGIKEQIHDDGQHDSAVTFPAGSEILSLTKEERENFLAGTDEVE